MQVITLLLVGGGALVGIVGTLIGYRSVLRSKKQDAASLAKAAAEEAKQLTARGRDEAERARAAALIEGKTEALKLREEAEREVARRREELERSERRFEERDQTVTRRGEELDRQAKAVSGQQSALAQKELSLEGKSKEIEALIHEQRQRLERIAGLPAEDARKEFLRRVEDEARSEAQALSRDIREQAKKSAERDAKRVIAMTIQRVAAPKPRWQRWPCQMTNSRVGSLAARGATSGRSRWPPGLTLSSTILPIPWWSVASIRFAGRLGGGRSTL